MKRSWIFPFSLFVLILITANKSAAVSPMPHEIETEVEKKATEKVTPGEHDTVCSINVVYTKNVNPAREDYHSFFIIKGPVQKKDAFEKTLGVFDDELKKDDVSEVSVECKFPAGTK